MTNIINDLSTNDFIIFLLFVMIEQQEEQYEYDVFYRGTKQQLYAFLYPLSGPSNPIFQHLQLKHLYFDANNKTFQANYQPKDFQNIDKQKEDVIYTSKIVPTQSNYFYSIYQPDYKCFIWQNLHNFVEMRPKNRGINSSKEENLPGNNKIDLQIVEYESSMSKSREIIEDAIIQPLKDNWQVSTEEYLHHLTK